jgi:hypothetical protein
MKTPVEMTMLGADKSSNIGVHASAKAIAGRRDDTTLYPRGGRRDWQIGAPLTDTSGASGIGEPSQTHLEIVTVITPKLTGTMFTLLELLLRMQLYRPITLTRRYIHCAPFRIDRHIFIHCNPLALGHIFFRILVDRFQLRHICSQSF